MRISIFFINFFPSSIPTCDGSVSTLSTGENGSGKTNPTGLIHSERRRGFFLYKEIVHRRMEEMLIIYSAHFFHPFFKVNHNLALNYISKSLVMLLKQASFHPPIFNRVPFLISINPINPLEQYLFLSLLSFTCFTGQVV